MKQLSKYVEENKLILTQNEIKKLFNNTQKNQDLIIKTQLPLILSIANSFSKTTGTSIEALFSKGLEATFKALFKYKITSDATYTTFNKKVVTNALKDYRLHNDNTIKQPAKNKDLPTIKAYPFSNFINEKDEPFENNISSFIEEKYYSDEDKLEAIINDNLKPSYATIVINYFGINKNKPKTFDEVAEELNTTKQNVHDKYQKAITKLQANKHFKALLKNLYNL